MSFPTRLKFDKKGQKLVNTPENLEIVRKISESKAQSQELTRVDVIEKLSNYILLKDKFSTTPRLWIRYININDGKLRGGGFPIRNERDEPFIVLKNVSKNFTFSIQRANVILFQSIPKNSLIRLSEKALEIINRYENLRGSSFVVIDEKFKKVNDNQFISKLSKQIDVDRKSLGKAFLLKKLMFKNFILFKLDSVDIKKLKKDIKGIKTDEVMDESFKEDVSKIIDQFYS